MRNTFDVITLFSGGLDSLLTARLLEEQGLNVLCVHYVSPFFGNPCKISHWERIWKLKIVPVDISRQFCEMLLTCPPHGFGSALNPCVDCKILILKHAKQLLAQWGASFLATGEVIGQRPMSQRRDSLDLIRNAAGVKDLLLRPLCALRLPPTPMEESGLVDRSRLCGFHGRGRNEQLELARKFGLTDLPSPAGGCVLTEKENARRYWPILKRGRRCGLLADELAADFRMGRMGRQIWFEEGGESFWFCLGRNSRDNSLLLDNAQSGDLTLKLRDFSGPVGLARGGCQWKEELVNKAGGLLASCSSAARKESQAIVTVYGDGKRREICIQPTSGAGSLPGWEEVKTEIKGERLLRMEMAGKTRDLFS